MHENIKTRFTPDVIAACAARFGACAEGLEPLGLWQNAVFGFEREGCRRILRISHDSHRTQKLISEELDFIRYLSANGVCASLPVPSLTGNEIETVRTETDAFHAVCFERASGREWEFSEQSVFAIGETTGLIRRLSREYKRDVRYHWYDNGYLRERNLYLPEAYASVAESAEKLLARLRKLPRERESYGLVHGDINGRNYLVDDENRVTLFDFDECQLDWYADDVAIQLFYYTYVFEDVYERAEFFLKNFLRGYRRHAELTRADVEIMPLLLQMRELIVFTGMCRGLDFETLSPYARRFVERLSLMGRPLYLDIDRLRPLLL